MTPRRSSRTQAAVDPIVPPQRRDPRSLLLALLVGLAMIFGGGGVTAPLSETALEIIAAGVLVAWAWRSGDAALFNAPHALWWIIGLVVALPLLQLMPLPPALWHALPGRGTERAALALVGKADTWRAWTVAPALTLAALLSLAPAVLVALGTATLGRAGRNQAIAMVGAIGLVALLVGVAQMSGGDDGPFRFFGTRSGNLEGFQANRNHAADVLLIAMVGFAAAAREWQVGHPRAVPPATLLALVAGVTVLLSIGTVVTSSRMGVALLPLAWIGVALAMSPFLKLSRRVWLGLLAGGLVAAIVVGLLASHNHVLARIAARFTMDQEFRPRIWADSLYTAKVCFPFGSGVGTFVPVFQAMERLENVDVFLTNRAHNDVLELAIEGGAVAIAAMLAVVAIIIVRAVRSIRRPPVQSAAQVIFALATLTIIALHSQVDYPLRSMSLQCLAGLAIGLLMAHDGRNENMTGYRRRPASMRDVT